MPLCCSTRLDRSSGSFASAGAARVCLPPSAPPRWRSLMLAGTPRNGASFTASRPVSTPRTPKCAPPRTASARRSSPGQASRRLSMIGRGAGDKRRPPSRKLRSAIAECAASFNAVHEDLAWFVGRTLPGAERDKLTALLVPLEALLSRHAPATSAEAAPADTTLHPPAEPPKPIARALQPFQGHPGSGDRPAFPQHLLQRTAAQKTWNPDRQGADPSRARERTHLFLWPPRDLW